MLEPTGMGMDMMEMLRRAGPGRQEEPQFTEERKKGVSDSEVSFAYESGKLKGLAIESGRPELVRLAATGAAVALGLADTLATIKAQELLTPKAPQGPDAN